MSEREYFNKLIKLLSGGGALVLRQLLEKYSAPLSFVDYIYTNQATVLGLKFFENQRQLVVTRAIANMDITLLGKLVKGLFNNKMTTTERTSVNNIKEERDNFMHSDVLKEAKIEEHAFNRRWKTISSILLDAAVEIGPSEFKTDVERFISETQESAPQGNEIHEILITWCESNEQLAEQVHESKEQLAEQVREYNEQVRESNVQLAENVQETKDLCISLVRSFEYGPVDSLKEKFQCNYEYNNKLDTKVTDSMDEAIGHLQKAYSVLLYGNPGEGKTFSALRIVKNLVQNNIVTLNRCALLSNPKDLSLIKRADIDLILIDDIFGRHNADSNRFSAWETEFPTLQSIVGTRKIRLIMCSRMHIYEQYRKKLDGLDIFSRTTELSSAKLSPEEKREIIIQQMEFYKRNVNEVNVNECISHALVGFPLCAQQFACDDLMFSRKTDYFRKPYRYFLEQNIKTLDDQSFIALLFVFYKGNKLQLADLDITRMSKDTQSLLVHIANLRGVEKPTSLIVRETKEKVVSMKGSYIKTIDKEVSFFHDLMYEAIAQIHYEEYPAEVIKYCTLDYLCQCVYLEGHKNGEGVTINEADLRPFVERCSYELTEEGKGWNKARWWRIKTFDAALLNHRIFEHLNCRRELLSHMQRDIKTFENFLTLSIPAYSRRYHSKWFNDGTFWKELMPYLDCSHEHEMDYGCLKCMSKAGILSAACYYNWEDVHTFLRSNKVPVDMKSSILYKAVMNKNIETDFVKYLTAELVNTYDLSITDKYLMQSALGVALSHSSSRLANTLNASGLLPSSVICYCAIRIGSHQEIHASVLFQPLLQYNQRQPNVYHVLKRMKSDKGDANITCELITATKNAQEPFQNLDLIIHGIRFMREWAILARLEQEDEDESSRLVVKDIQAWEAAMSSFLELKLDENVESGVLNEETALTTSLLLKELTMAGLGFRLTTEQLNIITQRKTDDKSRSSEEAVICALALIDEDLSTQPRSIWRYMESSDTANTSNLLYRYLEGKVILVIHLETELYGDNLSMPYCPTE